MWASTFGNCVLLVRGFEIPARYPPVTREIAIVVSAYNEADRLGATLDALGDAFPGARVMVADDHSADETPRVATAAGAELVRAPKHMGKGGANTIAVRRLLERGGPAELPTVVLCDGDLGASARELPRLVEALEKDEGDLAVGAFARRVGGGFGVALGFSRWAIRRRTGLEPAAPISGQRALRPEVVPAVLPFAPGFGMETAMTIDAHRAGFRLVEVELPLEHRATGRTLGGFVHRFRQLLSFARVYVSRR
jgi:glycosyltransferase involved in cell wall biosynthesis